MSIDTMHEDLRGDVCIHEVSAGSMMHTLIEVFHQHEKDALNANDFDAMGVYGTAESMSNNCHSKNNEQIRENLTAMFTDLKQSCVPTEKDAWDMCLLIVRDIT